MYRHSGLLFAFSVLLASGANAADAQGPVPDGARVSLRVEGGPRLVLGDAIDVTFTLSNAGTTPFAYVEGRDYRVVVNENQVPLPKEWTNSLGGLSGSRALPPGLEFSQRLRVQRYVRVNRPGGFTIRVVPDFGWQATSQIPLPVAEAQFTVVLPTPEHAAERIRVLAATQRPLREHELGSVWTETEFRYVNHPIYLSALETAAATGLLQAFEGIHRIETQEATRSLTRLLQSPSGDTVHAAAFFLSRRMPARVANGYPRTLDWYPTPEDHAAYAKLWLTEASAPLQATGVTLLHSADTRQVRTGAFIIESLGTVGDAAAVLDALAVTLKGIGVRDTPLTFPLAADALIAALEGLRERGYRAPANGGIEVVMAQFLELADSSVPRRVGWEQRLEAFFTQNPGLLREAAVRALPKPPTGKWVELLRGALDDRDPWVMRQACVVAGESGNAVFTEPLSNIVRSEPNRWVVDSASSALTRLGAHAAATEAWIERLSDGQLFIAGLTFLAEKLQHPTSGGFGSVGASMTREIRFAMREKWRLFFADAKRLALVQAGLPVPVTEDQARDLLGGVFEFTIDENRHWPARKE